MRTKTSLDDRTREIAICRVAVCNGAWYEWGHHAPLARAAGVSEEGMGVVGRDVLVLVEEEEGGEDGDGDGDGEERSRKEAERAGLGEREWAVLRYADEMTRNVRVSEEVFGALRRVCSEREVVEVTATVS